MGPDSVRTLVLMRHAKSAWPGVPDHERPLARRGQRDAPVMGGWLRAAGQLPDAVLCSTARRARETWQLARAGLGVSPPVSYDGSVYDSSVAELLDVIRDTPPSVHTLLVVGHAPALPELALTLAAAPLPGGRDMADESIVRIRAKFPTAALAFLEFTGSWDQLAAGTARLTAFVTPRGLRSSASQAPDAP